MNVADAARRLGMSATGVRKACDEGRLRCRRNDDGEREIEEDDLTAFATERQRTQAGGRGSPVPRDRGAALRLVGTQHGGQPARGPDVPDHDLLPKESFLIECPHWLNWDHFYELKRRWKVSVGALVRRAFDLKCISEATYRRAYVHLNKTGERTHERDEPASEPPTLLSKAILAVQPDITVQDLATRAGLSVADLVALVDLGAPTIA